MTYELLPKTNRRQINIFNFFFLGKTFIAKAAVTACRGKVALFAVSASDVRSKYVGNAEKILNAMFKYANQCAPSMIVIGKFF